MMLIFSSAGFFQKIKVQLISLKPKYTSNSHALILTVFEIEYFLSLLLEASIDLNHQNNYNSNLKKDNWDLETYRKS